MKPVEQIWVLNPDGLAPTLYAQRDDRWEEQAGRLAQLNPENIFFIQDADVLEHRSGLIDEALDRYRKAYPHYDENIAVEPDWSILVCRHCGAQWDSQHQYHAARRTPPWVAHILMRKEKQDDRTQPQGSTDQ